MQIAERPPYSKPSVLVSKYPRLKEIESKLKEQNKAIFGREKKWDELKKELFECTGIFKGGRRIVKQFVRSMKKLTEKKW